MEKYCCLVWDKVYPYLHTFKKEILRAFITCIFPFKCYCVRNVNKRCLIPFKDLFYYFSKQDVLLKISHQMQWRVESHFLNRYIADVKLWELRALYTWRFQLHMLFLWYSILRRCFINLLNIKSQKNLGNSPIRPIHDKITCSKRNSSKTLSPVIY